MKRNQLILIAIVIGIIGVAVTYPLWSPYFINDVVDEAFPELTDSERDAIRDMSDEQQEMLISMSEDNPEMANDTARSMAQDDSEMNDDMPGDEPLDLERGLRRLRRLRHARRACSSSEPGPG